MADGVYFAEYRYLDVLIDTWLCNIALSCGYCLQRKEGHEQTEDTTRMANH